MADAITAKARAIYGKRLTKEDYNNLLHKRGVSGVVAYLKTTEKYRAAFANVNETQIHRGQVEQLLAKEVFELYIKLCRFMSANKNSFSSYMIKELEIKQIVSALTYINADYREGYLREMPAYLMEYLSFDLMKLSRAGSYEEVLEVVADTPYYKVLKPLLSGAKKGDGLEECAVALYSYFIKWAFKAIDREYKGEEAKSLKEIFLRQSDLSNIVICYRKRSLFNEDKEQIKKSLYEHYYRVTPAVIDDILSQPESDKKLLALLNKVYLKNKIEYDPMFLEIAVRRYNNSFFKRQLNFTSNGPMALYSLMGLCQVERSNLQKIIESARYDRSPEETEKLLVY
ncbi:MAG: V-type ATPase subunit [Ruminococcaceae bacterium]|nr:V-type ATPase subunit [Oscillospiraceae bacterium]